MGSHVRFLHFVRNDKSNRNDKLKISSHVKTKSKTTTMPQLRNNATKRREFLSQLWTRKPSNYSARQSLVDRVNREFI
jgi:hypothetical protein